MSTINDRIRVRAYYAAQNDGYAHSPEHYWLAAERNEWAITEREELEATERAMTLKRKRSEAAKRGAATKAANKLRKLTVPASFDAYAHLRNAPRYAN